MKKQLNRFNALHSCEEINCLSCLCEFPWRDNQEFCFHVNCIRDIRVLDELEKEEVQISYIWSRVLKPCGPNKNKRFWGQTDRDRIAQWTENPSIWDLSFVNKTNSHLPDSGRYSRQSSQRWRLWILFLHIFLKFLMVATGLHRNRFCLDIILFKLGGLF